MASRFRALNLGEIYLAASPLEPESKRKCWNSPRPVLLLSTVLGPGQAQVSKACGGPAGQATSPRLPFRPLLGSAASLWQEKQARPPCHLSAGPQAGSTPAPMSPHRPSPGACLSSPSLGRLSSSCDCESPRPVLRATLQIRAPTGPRALAEAARSPRERPRALTPRLRLSASQASVSTRPVRLARALLSLSHFPFFPCTRLSL